MKNRMTHLFKTLILVSAFGATTAFADGASAPATATTVIDAKKETAICNIMDPTLFTQNAVDKVLLVLKADKSFITSDFPKVKRDVEKELKPYIGINYMARFLVSQAMWDNATRAQQQEFEEAFLIFIMNVYVSAFQGYTDQIIKVLGTRSDWKTASIVQIDTLIQSPSKGPNADIPVSFILKKDNCNWFFVDFVVSNISAMSNIQGQIQSMNKAKLFELTRAIQEHENARG